MRMGGILFFLSDRPCSLGVLKLVLGLDGISFLLKYYCICVDCEVGCWLGYTIADAKGCTLLFLDLILRNSMISLLHILQSKLYLISLR